MEKILLNCSFVFNQSGDGISSEEKIIHAHKLILSTVSPFFEVNSKTEWIGKEAIPITVCEYSVFEKLITAN